MQSPTSAEQFLPRREDRHSEDDCVPHPIGAALLQESAVEEWDQTVMYWEADAAFGTVGWEGRYMESQKWT